MSGRKLGIAEVARLVGRQVPVVGKRGFCPIRKHKRADKTFSVFVSSNGTMLWKCFSCDPPDNVGDAVKLYAVLTGQDRKQAWVDLKDRGFEVPGLKDGPSQPVSRPAPKVIPIQGRVESKNVIKLDSKRWEELRRKRLGAVDDFALARGLDPDLLRELDVVDMSETAVGFGYRDPATREPCRVKARAIDKKTFWIEPRAREGEAGTALSPLYLGHDIVRADANPFVVVVEGEVDALTLRAFGIGSAVSLPDGASSAAKVDLTPLWYRSPLVLSATDADDEGDRAHRDLFARVSGMGKQIARVRWQSQAGEVFKDANDALLQGGFSREDFLRCLEGAASQLRGYDVRLDDVG